MLEVTRPIVTTGPTIEPLTLSQARKQLEIATSESEHDEQLGLLISAAREQWEHDTDSACLTQSLKVYLQSFCDDYIYLPTRPIQSVTSIKYYDSLNVQQTFAASNYSLNKADRKIQLGYLKLWPTTLTRWDAIEITYVAGYATSASVPSIAKQAMLLLVSHYFENRDMIGNAMREIVAYENLVRRFQRASYP